MANITITNQDVGSVILQDAQFEDATITFAGADTFAPGTILARDSVSLKHVLFAKGGVTNENGIPKAVLTHEVVATGAGDETGRVAIKGLFRKERLIIDADGDDSNIDGAVKDQLRSYGLTPVSVTELNELDNQ